MELVGAFNKIIFVDEEDTRLAPLAEGLLKMKLYETGAEGLEVCSRGNVVLFPEPVNPKVEEMAGRLEISLSGHTAKQLSEEDFTPGTLAIALDSSCKAKIYEKYVSAANAFTLKEILDENGDIYLPAGASDEQYETAGETVDRLVTDLADRLAALVKENEECRSGEEKMIAIGSDHAGYDMKLALKEHLEEKGLKVKDMGCFSKESCDYPDFAKKVAEAVAEGAAEKGVLVCGTGIGMSMAANKVPGVRAGLATDEFMAQMTREHNDANVLCLGARVIDTPMALRLLDIFMETPFSGEEKHMRRISKLEGRT